MKESYLAGIIDGEGCISIAGRQLYSVQIQVVNTSKKLIEYFDNEHQDLLKKITDKKVIDDDMDQAISKAFTIFNQLFKEEEKEEKEEQ